MKKLLFALLATGLLFTAVDVHAASRSDRRVRKMIKDKKERKRQAMWLTDLSTALQESAKTGKPIMLLITGSTWCPPCKALEKKVLKSSYFNKYASENLVLLKVDIPRRTGKSLPRASQEILQKYSPKGGGVPHVVIIDSKGKVKERKGGYGGQNPTQYIRQFKSLKAK